MQSARRRRVAQQFVGENLMSLGKKRAEFFLHFALCTLHFAFALHLHCTLHLPFALALHFTLIITAVFPQRNSPHASRVQCAPLRPAVLVRTSSTTPFAPGRSAGLVCPLSGRFLCCSSINPADCYGSRDRCRAYFGRAKTMRGHHAARRDVPKRRGARIWSHARLVGDQFLGEP